MNFKKVPKT